MSAQGEKNQLIKPSESPEKNESDITEEKDNVKEDHKANIGTSDPHQDLSLFYFLIFILF